MKCTMIMTNSGIRVLVTTKTIHSIQLSGDSTDLSEGKEFGEYLLDLAKRKVLRADMNEYWKLYEKLQCWKNEVWCQLLKSQISALT